MPCPQLADLPAPPPDKSGWPWTSASGPLPACRPDGSEWPAITVVTPSFNQGAYLEETIRSILLQNYPRLQYVVIDGGSTDGSLEILRKYASWIDYWVSEPDRGQADALNKGYRRATGEIVNFINSDDLLTPNALRTVAAAFEDCDVVAGACENFSADGFRKIVPNQMLAVRGLVLGSRDVSFQQPSLWMRRGLVESCGAFDETFHYAFDWDLCLRYLALFPRVSYIPGAIARFRLHPNSKTVNCQKLFGDERVKILNKLRRLVSFADAEPWISVRLREAEWWSELDRLNRSNAPGIRRAVNILWRATLQPRIRFTRFTAGAVRRALWPARSDSPPTLAD